MKNVNSQKAVALKMIDVTGIFFIFGTGVTLGLVSFVAEILLAKLTKK